MSYADRISAHYVTWLVPEEFEKLDGDWRSDCAVTPELGLYDVRDEDIIARHAKWSLDHGINWWWMSWWGRNHVSDEVFESFRALDTTDDVEFSVLFESAGLLEWDGEVVDFDNPVNRERLTEHFRYFEEEFFDEPNYGHIDGRPVVFMFSSLAYEDDLEAAFAEATDALETDPYLVGDEVIDFGSVHNWSGPTEGQRERLDVFDAVTTYSSWKPRDDIDDIGFVDRVMDAYAEWHDACADRKAVFIPQVMPGYDDTQITHVPSREPHPVLSRDQKRFANMCNRAREFVDDNVGTAFVTSFNEWFEGSSVEPSTEEGTVYLEVLSEHLASS